MNNYLNFLLVQLQAVHLVLGSDGLFFCLKLDVGKASACSVWVALQLARKDASELGKNAEKFLLGDCLVDVLDQDVGLLIKCLLVLLH